MVLMNFSIDSRRDRIARSHHFSKYHSAQYVKAFFQKIDSDAFQIIFENIIELELLRVGQILWVF